MSAVVDNVDEKALVNKLEQNEILTLKTAACAISLGTAIIKEMIGDSISKSDEVDINELVAASLFSELRL